MKSKIKNPKKMMMTNNDKKVYNLEERTALFGENIIEFCKSKNKK